MKPREFIAEAERLLITRADPEKAAGMAAYMQQRFEYLGVQTPIRVEIIKPLLKSVKAVADEAWLSSTALLLWKKPKREYQYVALDLIETYKKQLTAEGARFLEGLAATKSWWDTVDYLASKQFGPLVLRFPTLARQMDSYSKHLNFWLRRMAILHQLNSKEKTDASRLFRYCTLNAGSEEFFIRKAIGWALCQYARTDAKAVIGFVQANRSRLSSLSVREALKHFPDKL